MKNRVHGQGFTLAELLVAIAIIAILAALLLPALSRVRNQSAKATDLDNLHQTMVAMQVYAQNNKDSLPWSNWDYGPAGLVVYAGPDSHGRGGVQGANGPALG